MMPNASRTVVAPVVREIALIDEQWREVRRAVDFGQWAEARAAVERVREGSARLVEMLQRSDIRRMTDARQWRDASVAVERVREGSARLAETLRDVEQMPGVE